MVGEKGATALSCGTICPSVHLGLCHLPPPRLEGFVLPNPLTQPPRCTGLRDIDIYSTSSTGNQRAQHRISWHLPALGLYRQWLWSNLATRFMNQSIFIAGNNPSSCLVCAHTTLLQAHPGALGAKCWKGLGEHLWIGGKREGFDTIKNQDKI